MAFKKIIVTGAAGFIGSELVRALSLDPPGFEGAEIWSVDSKDYFRARPQIAHHAYGNLVDRDEFLSQLSDGVFQPDLIVHLGACSRTTETNAEFLRTNNLEYSKSIWNHCTRKQIPLIYASSAATYGNYGGRFEPYEDDESTLQTLHPLNLYGKSKHDFDLFVLEQEQRGHTPPAWSGFKFFNVYGFGEAHKGPMASVVWHAFQQIRQSARVRLFKSARPDIRDGEQKRDFICVEDVIRVLLFAAQHPIQRGIFNLGTGTSRSFYDLALAVFSALKTPVHVEWIDTPPHLRDQYQYFTQASMQKLRNAGYSEPFLSLEDGVQLTISRLVALT